MTDAQRVQAPPAGSSELKHLPLPLLSVCLSVLQVSKVVSKVKQLVDVAKINGSLASTVVTIISNVMSSSHTPLQSTTSGT